MNSESHDPQYEILNQKKRILVVEDESIVAKDIQNSLTGMGYEVPAVFARGEDVVEKAREIMPDLVLMDIVLKGEMNGIEAAGIISSELHISVIFLTAYADKDTLDKAKLSQPFGYIVKPFDDRELQSTIEMALYKHSMEKKLIESHEWFSTTLSSIGDAVIATDTKGNVSFMNPVAEALTGWKKEEAEGRYIEEVFNIVNESTGKKVECPVKKVIKDGVVVGLANHTILIARDGARVPIDDSGAPIMDSNGKITGTVLVFHDVGEGRKMEARLIQSRQDWQETFDTITDMITIHDSDYNIILANRAAQKLLDLPHFTTDDKAVKCFRHYHGKEQAPSGCPSCECLKTANPATFEVFEPHLDMFIEIRAMPRFDRNNKLIGLIHIVRDITERKKIETEHEKLFDSITKAKEEWETTFNSVGELIALIDIKCVITRCNRSFAEFAGCSIDEITGEKYSDIIPFNIETIGNCNEKGGAMPEFQSKKEIKTETGRWLHVSHYPAWDDEGELRYSIVIATDITDLEKTRNRLSDSKEELNERVRELEGFYDMAVNRELKMKKLKEENKRLKERLA